MPDRNLEFEYVSANWDRDDFFKKMLSKGCYLFQYDEEVQISEYQSVIIHTS